MNKQRKLQSDLHTAVASTTVTETSQCEGGIEPSVRLFPAKFHSFKAATSLRRADSTCSAGAHLRNILYLFQFVFNFSFVFVSKKIYRSA